MIPPQKLSPIAEKYNPDLLNKLLEALIRQYSYALFFSLKDKVLKAKNHLEWFLKLLNLAHRNQNNFLKYNVNIWNDFIKICKKEDKNFTIDFSGCTFENEEECNFSGIELPNIIFDNTTFKGEANFEKATFKDEANFGNTTFEDEADFGNTTFENKANFESAKFKGFLDLGNIVLKDSVNFKNTVFESGNFQNESFTDISFDGAIFKKANFQNKKFKNTSFEKATFENEANFGNTTFKDEANFEKATFQGEAVFKETIFETAFDKKIDFSKAIFKGVTYFTFPTKASNPETDIYAELSFENAIFEKETTFHRRKFFGDTSFIDAEFHFPPAFSMGEEYNPHLLNFTRTKLILSEPPQTLNLWETDIKKENKNIDSKALTRVRNLRKLAGQIKEHDFEIDLFILERLLNSRINFKSKHFILRCTQQILIFLYWSFSDYGRKAWLPLTYLLISVLGLSSFLSFFSKFNFCDALTVSATNAIPFVNRFSDKTQSIFNKYFGMEEIPNCYIWIFSAHSLFSIVMIFLFSLAIRNYFRIK